MRDPGWKKIMVVPAWTLDRRKLIKTKPYDTMRSYWTEKGIDYYWSPRHSKEWLEEELKDMPEYWFRQEYLCEFVELEEQIFKLDVIESSLSDHDLLFGNAEQIAVEDIELLEAL
jgi:hypothetical protein